MILADRGKVILPLRNLQGFNELDDALNFADDIVIGIDWSDKIEASHSDFRIDIVDLLHQLIKRDQLTICFTAYQEIILTFPQVLLLTWRYI